MRKLLTGFTSEEEAKKKSAELYTLPPPNLRTVRDVTRYQCDWTIQGIMKDWALIVDDLTEAKLTEFQKAELSEEEPLFEVDRAEVGVK